jgi:hypothetical protein
MLASVQFGGLNTGGCDRMRRGAEAMFMYVEYCAGDGPQGVILWITKRAIADSHLGISRACPLAENNR